MRSHSKLVPLMVLLLALTLWGCPKRPEVVQAPPAPAGPPAMAPAAPPAPAPAPEVQVAPPAAPAPAPPMVVQETVKETQVTLMDIFFDFDRSNLKDDQKAALQADLATLKADPKLKLLIEGHCDERGTVEYNLALGERRAKAVKDALSAAGISADRLSIISYGKERPFVLGHDESAWKMNRRAHFVMQKM